MTGAKNNETNRKRIRANLTIRADILTEAKAMGVNTSRAAEFGIEGAVKRAKEKAWLEENAAAIRAHNQRVEQFGMMITPSWLKC